MKGARPLTPLEVHAVYTAFNGKYAVRNRTLFLICTNIGTRITEALNLNVGDVLQSGEVVEVVYLRRETVKGKHEGIALTLPSGARNALTEFIAWKRAAKESLAKHAPLFMSRKHGRLTRQQAHNTFKTAYQKIGLKGQLATHSPRKTYAKHVYDNSGNDLIVTQRALRHTSIGTTLYYLDALSDDVTDAMPNFDFGEFDVSPKTSNSKIVTLPKPKRTQARRK